MGLRGVPQESATLRTLLLPHTVGQETEVPQPGDAARRDVEHQPSQEFYGLEREGTQTVASLVVLRAEGHLAPLQGHEPMVRNGDAMGRARQVGEDVLGLLEGLFGVDHPLHGAPRREEPLPGWGLAKFPTTTRAGQLALAIEPRTACEGEAPEAAREDPHGPEEVGTTRHPTRAIRCEPPGGQDTMEMGMVGQLLAPGVEHGKAPDLSPEMLGGLSNVLERLGDRAKEQAIEVAGVLQRQGPQGVRQGKDDMDVGRVEYLALPGCEPWSLSRTMTFGTAAVATGVIRLHFVPAMITLRDMAPEGSGPAQRDGPQGPLLFAREGGARAGQKGIPMLAHHIGDFKGRAPPGSWSRCAGNARASRGLSVACSAGWATWR
jgi:hypothetical protein